MLNFNNIKSTNSTFTNLFALNSQFTNITISNFIINGLTTTNIVATRITTTNLSATSTTFTDLTFTTGIAGNIIATNMNISASGFNQDTTVTTLSGLSISSGHLLASNIDFFRSTFSNLSATNLTATDLITTNIVASSVNTISNLVATTLITTTNLNTINLVGTSNTMTNVVITRNTTTNLVITSATDSASPTSGAVVVAGGVGIFKYLNVGSSMFRTVAVVSYFKNTVQNINDSTNTLIEWDSSAYNNQGTGINFYSGSGATQSSFTNTTSRTVVFLVSYAVGYASNANSKRAVWILKNGTTVYGREDMKSLTGAPTTLTGCSQIIMNNTTDYIQIITFQNTGGTVSLTSGNAVNGTTVAVAIM